MVVHVIFPNPLTICSLSKQKLVVCPFGDGETNGSYPFANRLNVLNEFKQLCPSMVFVLYVICCQQCEGRILGLNDK